jgi:hypothetical protein
MKQFCLLIMAISMIACNDNSSDGKTEVKTESVTENPLLTAEEQKEGWQLLFDGSSTDGWHSYGGAPVGYAWKVVDGALHFDGSLKKDTLAQDIMSNDEFENFHLKLEWKVDTNGNSGIMFYVNEDTSKFEKPYWTGPEMQVLDNSGHPDAKITKHRAGDLYDLISSSKETVKPALEWNQAEIKAVNGKLDFYLNGENIVSTTMWDDNWNKMIAASKFKQWPGFGTFKKGRICLQDHGDKVWFRNIKIRKL